MFWVYYHRNCIYTLQLPSEDKIPFPGFANPAALPAGTPRSSCSVSLLSSTFCYCIRFAHGLFSWAKNIQCTVATLYKVRSVTFLSPVKGYEVFPLKISTNVLLEDLDLKETRKPNVFAESRIYLSLGRRNNKVDQSLFPVLQECHMLSLLPKPGAD